MSLFIYHTASEVLILLVYVDDILVIGSNQKLISHFISYLHDKFHSEILTLCPISWENSKPTPTPGSLGSTLSQLNGVPLPNPFEYHRTIGALQYITLSRPDIAFAINKACQFMSKPSDVHWLAGYSDADWASCPNDHWSNNSYCFFLSSNLISWSSSKQCLVSKAMPNLNIKELDLHFIQDKVLRQELHICYVLSSDQLVDILTKHLPISQFCSLHSKLTVTNPRLSLRGG
ncbi:Retrovirus-related Pol polyprotein from transposon RE2 [Vitis vinifera]|uniref:Retrovirus-related Pol polyprotein from transposon RE2 n=1 Tax=Vitis vinifera TaxID=29760 RepID=A0A438BQJ5_VITVI|nr:Retrovirus-related Pol polyprotein from transposon RE2 [Vitis vinifera]